MPIIGSAEIEVLANTARFADGLKKGVTGAAGAAVAATAGIIAAGVKQFGEFEAGINEVFTLLGADAPTETLTGIEDQVKNLSQSFGLDLQDAIGGTYDAISAGVDTSNLEVFEGFTETAAKFAAAGATDFGTSIDLMTTATNAFGLETSDAEHTADVLFATIKGGKTTADELAASLFQVAPVAAATGVSLEETAAGLATLTAQGVPTASAATQLRSAFGELAATGTKADKAFRDIAGQGFSQFLSSGGSVQEAFNLLRETADESGIPVTDFFGSIEAGSAVLGTTGEQADRFASNLENIGDSAGATQDAFDTMDSGIFASFAKIKQTLLVGLVDIGDAFAPFVKDVADKLQSGLPDLIDVFVGGFTKLADFVVPILGEVISAFRGFVLAFQDPDITSIGIFGLFEGLGASLRNIIDGLDLGGLFSSLFGDTSGASEGLTSAIDGVVRGLIAAQPTIISVSESIGTLLRGNAELARDVFVALAPVLIDLATNVLPVLADVLGIAASGLALIIDNVPTPVLVAAAAAFKAVQLSIAAVNAVTAAGGLVGYVSKLSLVTKATQLWASAQKALLAVLSAKAFVTDVASKIVGYLRSVNLTTVATRAWAAAQKVLNLSFLTSPITIAIAVIAALAAGIVIAYKHSETFRDAVDSLWAALGPVVDAVKLLGSALSDLTSGDFSGAFDKLKEAGDLLAGFFADLGPRIGQLLVDGFRAVVSGLNLADAINVDHVIRVVLIGVGLIRDAFGSIGEALSALFSGDFSGAFNGLLDAAGNLVAGFAVIGRTVIDALIEAIQAGLRGAGLGFLADAIEPVQALFFELISAVVAFGNAFANTSDGITQSGFVGLFEGLAIAARDLIDIFVQLGGVIVDVLTGDLDSALAGLSGLGESALDLFADLGRLLGETLIFALTSVLDLVGLDSLSDSIEGFLRGLADKVAEAAPGVFQALVTAAQVAFDAIETVVEVGIAAVGALIDAAQAVWNTGILQTIFSPVAFAIGAYWDFIVGNVRIAIATVGSIIDLAETIWDTGFIQAIFGVVADVIGAYLDFVVGNVRIAIATVGAIIGLAETIWDTGFIQAIFGIVLDVIGAYWGFIVGVVRIGIATVGSIIGLAETIWDTGFIQAIFGFVLDVIGAYWGFIVGVVRIGIATVGSIIGLAETIWDTGFIQAIFGFAADVIGLAWGLIEGAVRLGVDAVGAVIGLAETIWNTEFIQGVFGLVADVVGFAWGLIGDAVQVGVDAVGVIIDLAETIWNTGVLQAVFDEVADQFEVAWGLIEDFVQVGVDAVGALLETLETVWNLPAVQAVFDGLAESWSFAFDAASLVVTTVIDGFAETFETIDTVWNILQVEGIFGGIAAFWEVAWDSITTVLDEAVAAVSSVLGFFGVGDDGDGEGGGLGDTVGAVFDPIEGLWDTAWGGAVAIVQGVVDTLNEILGVFGLEIGAPSIENLFNNVSAIWDAAWGLATGTVQSAVDVITGLFDSVVTFVTEWGTRIYDAVSGRLSDLLTLFTDQYEAIRAAISDKLEIVYAFIVEWGTRIYDSTFGTLSDLLQAATDKFTEIADVISAKAEDAKVFLDEKFTAAKDLVTGIFSDIYDNVESTLSDLVTRVSGLADDAKEAITDAFQDVKDFLSGLLDAVSLGDIDVSGITGPVGTAIGKVEDLIDVIEDLTGLRNTSVGGVRLIPEFPGFAQGGVTRGPSIAGEDGAELVLPLTKGARMRALLERYGALIAQSVGGFDEVFDALAGGGLGSVSAVDPGPFPVLPSTSGLLSSGRSGSGQVRSGAVTQSITNYNFYGAEAGAVAAEIRDKRRSDIVEGVRVRA